MADEPGAEAGAPSGFLPPSLGRCSGARSFGNGPVVVVIQDLHCHGEVQRHIAQILSRLREHYGLDRVFVEGAAGRPDVSWFTGIQDETLRRDIVQELLSQGKLTGAEYFAVTSVRPVELRGLEDDSVYDANFRRLERIIAGREKFGVLTQRLGRELEGLKERYFNQPNRKFEAAVRKYRAGKLKTVSFYAGLTKYLERLHDGTYRNRNISDIGQAQYAGLVRYGELERSRKRLRYDRIGVQLRAFHNDLRQRVPYRVFAGLTEKAGSNEFGELYRDLAGLARAYPELVRNYPDLRAFFESLELQSALDPLAVLGEERRMIGEIRCGLSESMAEYEISFLADFLGYFEDFLHTRLSADDYAYVAQRREQFLRLWEKYTGENPAAGIGPDIALLDDYYRTNLERNTCFIDNLLPALGAQKGGADAGGRDPSAILSDAGSVVAVVAGGFHTAGLTDALEDRKISYVIVTPSASGNADRAERMYLELSKNQARIFEREMFALRLMAGWGVRAKTEAALEGLVGRELLRRAKAEPGHVAGDALAAIIGTSLDPRSIDRKMNGLCERWNRGFPEEPLRSVPCTIDANGDVIVAFRIVQQDTGRERTISFLLQAGGNTLVRNGEEREEGGGPSSHESRFASADDGAGRPASPVIKAAKAAVLPVLIAAAFGMVFALPHAIGVIGSLAAGMLLLPPILASMVYHEYAHAAEAVRRGDATPLGSGRMTVVRFWRHVDPAGLALMAAGVVLVGVPVGWLRPLTVDTTRLGPKGLASVLAAGPSANARLALVCALGAAAAVAGGAHESVTQGLVYGAQVNAGLALFNLLPIRVGRYVSDGYHLYGRKIARALRSRSVRGAVRGLERLRRTPVPLKLGFGLGAGIVFVASFPQVLSVAALLPFVLGICDRQYIEWRMVQQREAEERRERKEEEDRKKKEEEERRKAEEEQRRAEEVQKALDDFIENLETVIEDEGKINRLLDDLAKHDIRNYAVRYLGGLVDAGRLNRENFAGGVADELVERRVFEAGDRQALRETLASDEMRPAVEGLVGKAREAFRPLETGAKERLFEEETQSAGGILSHAHLHGTGAHQHHHQAHGPTRKLLYRAVIAGTAALALAGFVLASEPILQALMSVLSGQRLPPYLEHLWLAGLPFISAVGAAVLGPVTPRGEDAGLIPETEENPVERYTVNLAELAKSGRIDDSAYLDYIQQLNDLLSVGSKKNVVLVGDPGTTRGFIDAVACEVARKSPESIPESLRGTEFLYLNVASLLYVMAEIGKFEATIQELSDALEDAVRKGGKKYVFVFDFQHIYWIKRERMSLLNSVSFLFKNILNNRDIPVIALCNEKHYNEFFSSDRESLSSSFEKLEFKDLPDYKTGAHVRSFVRQARELYPELPGNVRRVLIGRETLEQSLKYIGRHMPYGEKPGKMQEMIDEILTRRIHRDTVASVRSNALREKVVRSLARYRDALRRNDGAEIGFLRGLLNAFARDAEEAAREADAVALREDVEIGLDDVVRIIGRETRMPEKEIVQETDDKLDHFVENIRRQFIGQDEAVDLTYKALSRRRAGMSLRDKPIGGFIFAGPTGVGKTELAKAVANQFFGNPEKIIRFDMSEYMERNSDQKLIGAPPGYAGYENGGQLTNAVMKDPYSVLLFDEIEKADSSVYDLLLQILDKGELTDSHGRKVSFKNTIIIMTSNLGMTAEVYELYDVLEALEGMSDEEFEVTQVLPPQPEGGVSGVPGRETRKVHEILSAANCQAATREEAIERLGKYIRLQVREEGVEKYFARRPELLSRLEAIGAIVVFDKLTIDDLRQVLDIKLRQKNEQLAGRGLELRLTPAMRDTVIAAGYDPKNGARPLERALARIVLAPLSREILKDAFDRGDIITADVRNGTAAFSVERRAKDENAACTPLIRRVEESLASGSDPDDALAASLFGLRADAEDPSKELLTEDELPIQLPGNAGDMAEQFVRAQEAGGRQVNAQEQAGLLRQVEAQRAADEALLNRFFRNISLEALRGQVGLKGSRSDDEARLIQVLEQRKRNYPFVVNRAPGPLNEFIEDVSRQCVTGRVPGFERVRFVKLNLERFSSQFTMIGKIEDQMRRFLDVIEADDKKKKTRTVIVIDYDELEKEIPIYRGGGLAAGQEGFNLGFFMLPFLGRSGVRLAMLTTKRDVASNEVFGRFFSEVKLEDLDGRESLEKFYLYDLQESPLMQEETKKLIEYNFAVLQETAELFAKRIAREPLGGVLDRYFEYLVAKKLKKKEALSTMLVRARENLCEELQEYIDDGELPVDQDRLLRRPGLIETLRRARELEAQLSSEQSQVHTVSLDDAYDFLTERYGLDREQLTVDEKKNALELEERLTRRIVGQDEAVAALADAIRIGKAGLKAPNKPMGTFLFPGPTGVGKTELVQQLGRELGMPVIRLDMSEYKKPQDVSKLIGSPPGYVGHLDAENWLTTRVRKTPKCVILFDEIDKLLENAVDRDGAYEKTVLDVLLQMLEDGRLTDSQGNTADFSQAIIIFTSNGGVNVRIEKTESGLTGYIDNAIYGEIRSTVLDDDEVKFAALKERIRERVDAYHRRMLRPEFLNRLDGTIIFNVLRKRILGEIVDLFLEDLAAQMRGKFQLVFGESEEEHQGVVRHLMSRGYSPEKGARGILALINKDLKDELNAFLRAQELLKKDDRIVVSFDDGRNGFAFRLERAQERSLREKAGLTGEEEAVLANIVEGLNGYAGRFPELDVTDVTPWLDPVPPAPRDQGKTLAFSEQAVLVRCATNDFTRSERGIAGTRKALFSEVDERHASAGTDGAPLKETVKTWLTEAVSLAKRENIRQTAWKTEGRQYNFYDMESGAVAEVMQKNVAATDAEKGVSVAWEIDGGILKLAVRYDAVLPRSLYRRLFEDPYENSDEIDQKANRLLQGYLKALLLARQAGGESGYSLEETATVLWLTLPLPENVPPTADLPAGDTQSMDGDDEVPAASRAPETPATAGEAQDERIGALIRKLNALFRKRTSPTELIEWDVVERELRGLLAGDVVIGFDALSDLINIHFRAYNLPVSPQMLELIRRTGELVGEAARKSSWESRIIGLRELIKRFLLAVNGLDADTDNVSFTLMNEKQWSDGFQSAVKGMLDVRIITKSEVREILSLLKDNKRGFLILGTLNKWLQPFWKKTVLYRAWTRDMSEMIAERSGDGAWKSKPGWGYVLVLLREGGMFDLWERYKPAKDEFELASLLNTVVQGTRDEMLVALEAISESPPAAFTPDRARHVCDMIAKTYEQGMSVLVSGPLVDAHSRELDDDYIEKLVTDSGLLLMTLYGSPTAMLVLEQIVKRYPAYRQEFIERLLDNMGDWRVGSKPREAIDIALRLGVEKERLLEAYVGMLMDIIGNPDKIRSPEPLRPDWVRIRDHVKELAAMCAGEPAARALLLKLYFACYDIPEICHPHTCTLVLELAEILEGTAGQNPQTENLDAVHSFLAAFDEKLKKWPNEDFLAQTFLSNAQHREAFERILSSLLAGATVTSDDARMVFEWVARLTSSPRMVNPPGIAEINNWLMPFWRRCVEDAALTSEKLGWISYRNVDGIRTVLAGWAGVAELLKRRDEETKSGSTGGESAPAELERMLRAIRIGSEVQDITEQLRSIGKADSGTAKIVLDAYWSYITELMLSTGSAFDTSALILSSWQRISENMERLVDMTEPGVDDIEAGLRAYWACLNMMEALYDSTGKVALGIAGTVEKICAKAVPGTKLELINSFVQSLYLRVRSFESAGDGPNRLIASAGHKEAFQKALSGLLGVECLSRNNVRQVVWLMNRYPKQSTRNQLVDWLMPLWEQSVEDSVWDERLIVDEGVTRDELLADIAQRDAGGRWEAKAGWENVLRLLPLEKKESPVVLYRTPRNTGELKELFRAVMEAEGGVAVRAALDALMKAKAQAFTLEIVDDLLAIVKKDGYETETGDALVKIFRKQLNTDFVQIVSGDILTYVYLGYEAARRLFGEIMNQKDYLRNPMVERLENDILDAVEIADIGGVLERIPGDRSPAAKRLLNAYLKYLESYILDQKDRVDLEEVYDRWRRVQDNVGQLIGMVSAGPQEIEAGLKTYDACLQINYVFDEFARKLTSEVAQTIESMCENAETDGEGAELRIFLEAFARTTQPWGPSLMERFLSTPGHTEAFGKVLSELLTSGTMSQDGVREAITLVKGYEDADAVKNANVLFMPFWRESVRTGLWDLALLRTIASEDGGGGWTAHEGWEAVLPLAEEQVIPRDAKRLKKLLETAAEDTNGDRVLEALDELGSSRASLFTPVIVPAIASVMKREEYTKPAVSCVVSIYHRSPGREFLAALSEELFGLAETGNAAAMQVLAEMAKGDPGYQERFDEYLLKNIESGRNQREAKEALLWAAKDRAAMRRRVLSAYLTFMKEFLLANNGRNKEVVINSIAGMWAGIEPDMNELAALTVTGEREIELGIAVYSTLLSCNFTNFEEMHRTTEALTSIVEKMCGRAEGAGTLVAIPALAGIVMERTRGWNDDFVEYQFYSGKEYRAAFQTVLRGLLSLRQIDPEDIGKLILTLKSYYHAQGLNNWLMPFWEKSVEGGLWNRELVEEIAQRDKAGAWQADKGWEGVLSLLMTEQKDLLGQKVRYEAAQDVDGLRLLLDIAAGDRNHDRMLAAVEAIGASSLDLYGTELLPRLVDVLTRKECSGKARAALKRGFLREPNRPFVQALLGETARQSAQGSAAAVELLLQWSELFVVNGDDQRGSRRMILSGYLGFMRSYISANNSGKHSPDAMYDEWQKIAAEAMEMVPLCSPGKDEAELGLELYKTCLRIRYGRKEGARKTTAGAAEVFRRICAETTEMLSAGAIHDLLDWFEQETKAWDSEYLRGLLTDEDHKNAFSLVAAGLVANRTLDRSDVGRVIEWLKRYGSQEAMIAWLMPFWVKSIEDNAWDRGLVEEAVSLGADGVWKSREGWQGVAERLNERILPAMTLETPYLPAADADGMRGLVGTLAENENSDRVLAARDALLRSDCRLLTQDMSAGMSKALSREDYRDTVALPVAGRLFRSSLDPAFASALVESLFSSGAAGNRAALTAFSAAVDARPELGWRFAECLLLNIEKGNDQKTAAARLLEMADDPALMRSMMLGAYLRYMIASINADRKEKESPANNYKRWRTIRREVEAMITHGNAGPELVRLAMELYKSCLGLNHGNEKESCDLTEEAAGVFERICGKTKGTAAVSTTDFLEWFTGTVAGWRAEYVKKSFSVNKRHEQAFGVMLRGLTINHRLRKQEVGDVIRRVKQFKDPEMLIAWMKPYWEKSIGDGAWDGELLELIRTRDEGGAFTIDKGWESVVLMLTSGMLSGGAASPDGGGKGEGAKRAGDGEIVELMQAASVYLKPLAVPAGIAREGARCMSEGRGAASISRDKGSVYFVVNNVDEQVIKRAADVTSAGGNVFVITHMDWLHGTNVGSWTDRPDAELRVSCHRASNRPVITIMRLESLEHAGALISALADDVALHERIREAADELPGDAAFTPLAIVSDAPLEGIAGLDAAQLIASGGDDITWKRSRGATLSEGFFGRDASSVVRVLGEAVRRKSGEGVIRARQVTIALPWGFVYRHLRMFAEVLPESGAGNLRLKGALEDAPGEMTAEIFRELRGTNVRLFCDCRVVEGDDVQALNQKLDRALSGDGEVRFEGAELDLSAVSGDGAAEAMKLLDDTARRHPDAVLTVVPFRGMDVERLPDNVAVVAEMGDGVDADRSCVKLNVQKGRFDLLDALARVNELQARMFELSFEEGTVFNTAAVQALAKELRNIALETPETVFALARRAPLAESMDVYRTIRDVLEECGIAEFNNRFTGAVPPQRVPAFLARVKASLGGEKTLLGGRVMELLSAEVPEGAIADNLAALLHGTGMSILGRDYLERNRRGGFEREADLGEFERSLWAMDTVRRTAGDLTAEQLFDRSGNDPATALRQATVFAALGEPGRGVELLSLPALKEAVLRNNHNMLRYLFVARRTGVTVDAKNLSAAELAGLGPMGIVHRFNALDVHQDEIGDVLTRINIQQLDGPFDIVAFASAYARYGQFSYAQTREAVTAAAGRLRALSAGGRQAPDVIELFEILDLLSDEKMRFERTRKGLDVPSIRSTIALLGAA